MRGSKALCVFWIISLKPSHFFVENGRHKLKQFFLRASMWGRCASMRGTFAFLRGSDACLTTYIVLLVLYFFNKCLKMCLFSCTILGFVFPKFDPFWTIFDYFRPYLVIFRCLVLVLLLQLLGVNTTAIHTVDSTVHNTWYGSGVVWCGTWQ